MSTDDTPSKPVRPWLRWTRDILILLLLFWLIQWWQSRDLVKDAAPPLVGHRLDGRAYQLDPTQGPTLVHFWAEWCPVCRLEEDSIDRIADDLPVMTVATTSGNAVEVGDYLVREGLSMPVLLDESGDIARRWGVRGVPATFIVDRSGMITSASMGYSTEWGIRLRMWWAGISG